MKIEEFISRKSKQLKNQNFIEITEEELKKIRVDEAQYIVERYHGFALMKIPPSEVAFFEWLRLKDEPVWNDIWEDAEDIYLVSTDLLPQFLPGKNGFPICDLVGVPNYWFSERHIKPKGREELERIIQKYQEGHQLKVDEMLLVELLNAPIDIWHFCYRFKLSVPAMKALIEKMVSDGWLVHLPDREDLVKYIEI